MDDRTAVAFMGLVEGCSLLNAAVDRQLREVGGVSQSQFEVLVRLSYAPDGMRMTDLAAVLVFSASGLTYQATQLEKRGLIERTRAPDGDERTVVARITAAGRELVERVRPGHLAHVQQLFASRLTPEQIDTLGQMLQALVAGLRAAD